MGMPTIQQNLTSANYNSRGTNPRFIVIHYTANDGDTAWGNTNYFKSVNRGASANLFVDDNSIWQCVRDTDTAWHIGNGSSSLGVYNNNSIGIEMCSRRKAGANANDLSSYYITDATVANTVELVKYLMKKYNIPASRVYRHYDITGKYCPAPMVYNNGNTTWTQFLQKIQANEEDLMSAEYDKLLAKINENHNAILGTLADMRKEYTPRTYAKLSEIPSWYQKAVKYMIDEGVLQGVSPTNLGVTDAECRMLTMMYRNMKLPD